MPNCTKIQRSLDWCMGTPELPGIKRRIFYIAKSQVTKWPQFERSESGQITSRIMQGTFRLREGVNWKIISVIVEKSSLTSDAQGEAPNQTQLNKLTAFHPGVGPESTTAASLINNSDNVFIVEDMKGRFRIVGSEKWITKSLVTQDLGQGPTGSTSTTISVEATDEVPSPFYAGMIRTDDGKIFTGSDSMDDNVNLTGDFYHSWSSASPNAYVTSRPPYEMQYGIRKPTAPNNTIFGNSSVRALEYVDASAFSYLYFEGTPGAFIRIIYNRETDTAPTHEINEVIQSDGTLLIDISDQPFFHINAIKIGNGSPTATITKMQLK